MNRQAQTPAAPAIWAIGDVQGCGEALTRLLAHPDIMADVHTNPDTRFWFAGDLVNRGPQSRAALRTIMALGERAVAVLGNHDLHLLAVAAGVRAPGRRDTLDDILNAPDVDDLITWLRHRPLAHFEAGYLMVHAGVAAPWTVAQTLALADEVQAMLRGPDWRAHLAHMYGDTPRRWKEGLTGAKRLRVIINTLTRMRLCTPDGRMALSAKGAPDTAPAGLLPWYEVPNRAICHTGEAATPIVFGHWSTLGLLLRPDVMCLDTGCVWGGQLTAVRLRDRRVVQVGCGQVAGDEQVQSHHE